MTIAAAVVAQALYVNFAPSRTLTFRTTDDAYYYFMVARNIVVGRGVTFDGMNPTNGFHPLWLMCVLPLYWLCGGDAECGLRLVLSLGALLAGSTAWIMYRAALQLAGRGCASVVLASLLTPLWYNALFNGLETGLLLLLLSILLSSGARSDLLDNARGARSGAFLGVLLALIFLCRLDCAFQLLAFVLLMVGRLYWLWYRKRGWQLLAGQIITVAVIGSAIVAPYFVWNVLTNGHATPISGTLKSTFPVASPLAPLWLKRSATFPGVFGSAQLMCTAAALVLTGFRLRREDPHAVVLGAHVHSMAWMLGALWMGCAVHYAYCMAFMFWAVHWWHFASYLPVTTLACGLALACVLHRIKRYTVLHATAGLVVLGVALWGHWRDRAVRGSHHGPWYDAALWCRENLPTSAVVAMADCGLYGHFCGRPTVNLDGVINGYDYQIALRDHRLKDYLAACGVTHVADYQVEYTKGRYYIVLRARLHKMPGSIIAATPHGEVYRSGGYRNVLHQNRDVHFAVWSVGDVEVFEDAALLLPGPWVGSASL